MGPDSTTKLLVEYGVTAVLAACAIIGAWKGLGALWSKLAERDAKLDTLQVDHRKQIDSMHKDQRERLDALHEEYVLRLDATMARVEKIADAAIAAQNASTLEHLAVRRSVEKLDSDMNGLRSEIAKLNTELSSAIEALDRRKGTPARS